jgi:3-methyl-2-oxobutanoate hydroxymethyltransferase
LRQDRKLTRTTGLDYFAARAIEEAGIDIIGLDGPPMEIFFKGRPHGEQATLEEVILCLEAVKRGAPNTFIMVPIPYGYAWNA